MLPTADLEEERESNMEILERYLHFMKTHADDACVDMSAERATKCKRKFLKSYDRMISRINQAHSDDLKNDTFVQQFGSIWNLCDYDTFNFKRSIKSRINDKVHDAFFDKFETKFFEEEKYFPLMEVFFQLDQGEESHLELIDPIYQATGAHIPDQYYWYDVHEQIEKIIDDPVIDSFRNTDMTNISKHNKLIRSVELLHQISSSVKPAVYEFAIELKKWVIGWGVPIMGIMLLGWFRLSDHR